MSAIANKRKSKLQEDIDTLNEEFTSGDYKENMAKFVTEVRDVAKVLFSSGSILSSIERMTTNRKMTLTQYLFVQDIVLMVLPDNDTYEGKVDTGKDFSVYNNILDSKTRKVSVSVIHNNVKYGMNTEIIAILRRTNLETMIKIITLYFTLEQDLSL